MAKNDPFDLYELPGRDIATEAVKAVINVLVELGFRQAVIEQQVDRLFQTSFPGLGGTDTASRDAIAFFIERTIDNREE